MDLPVAAWQIAATFDVPTAPCDYKEER